MNFLTNCLQFSSDSIHNLRVSLNLSLILLSFVVAVLASYFTLSLAHRLREEKRKRVALFWFISSIFTFCAGILSMNFIGLLAFKLPISIDYGVIWWTFVSLFTAMIALGFALLILLSKHTTYVHVMLGGILIGLIISFMHYMGMEGLKSQIEISYSPVLFFLSIFIAIAASELSLWLAWKSNKGPIKRKKIFKLYSALIMGIAICGSHYIAMDASIFTNLPTSSMTSKLIHSNDLSFLLALIIIFMFSLVLSVSYHYKKIVDTVENEKEFLNTMLDNLEDGIVACNDRGKITVINRAIQKYVPIDVIHKISIDDLHKCYQLYDSSNKPLTEKDYPLSRILKGEIIKKLPLTIKLKNENVEVIVDGEPIINKEGKKLGALVVIHNVTDLKRTEKIKNEFVSVVSHELKTPLTSIRGALRLLLGGIVGSFSEKVNKLLYVASNNCERLYRLINDILDIDALEERRMKLKMRNIHLSEVIRDAVNDNAMYANKCSVSLKVIQPVEDLIVYADPKRLHQVLINLLSNACKFSPQKETVGIEVQKKWNKVRVSVIDKGIGIPLEFQHKIFQKFAQVDASIARKQSGTGLGLSISKNIIEQMGGMLDFISSSEGTTFYFELPLSKE